MKKESYYSVKHILEVGKSCLYFVIYGERSNGKTYSTIEYCLTKFFESGDEFAYIRRWDDDIKGTKGESLFNSHVKNGLISKLSKGRYNSIIYRGRSYYLAKLDKEGGTKEVSDTPFAYAFALTMSEHYKGLSYPNIKNIIFDEFMTRGTYLPDEFIIFQNMLSTIIRLRDDVNIFMLGNTVNKYNPYIREMGLYKMGKQLKGTIDIYEYGDSGLRVAVEYSDFPTKEKKSNKYFAFDNPRLNMIKNGSWEIDIYPHYPHEYGTIRPNEVLYTFYVVFEGQTLECKIVEKDEQKYRDDNNISHVLPPTRFLFIHPKTTPIRDDETNLIYSTEVSIRPKYRVRMTKPISKLEKKIAGFFGRDKVFYSDNETGEIMRNYLAWCRN